MPTIPLIDLPSGPAMSGPPTLSPQLAAVPGRRGVDVSGAQLAPNGLRAAQGLLGEVSGNVRSGAATMARVIQGGKQDRISAAPFVAEYEGFDVVGRAIGTATNFLNAYAEKMQRARDVVAMAEASTIMDDAFTAHRVAVESGMPEVEWVPSWQKERIPEVQQRLAKIQASPEAKAQIQASWLKFSADTTGQFAVAATQRSLKVAQGKVLNASERAFDNGQYDEAFTLIDNAEREGILSSDIAESKRTSLIQAKEQEMQAVTIQKNPLAALDDLEAAGPDGESKLFPNTRPIERMKLMSEARSQRNLDLADQSRYADDSISSGEWTTPEQVQQYGEENRWPTALIADKQRLLKETFDASPAGQAKTEQYIAEVRAAVSNYDPSQDKNKNQLYELERMMSFVPEGRRDTLRSELDERKKSGVFKPSDATKSAVLGEINSMLGDGYFGTFTDGKGEDKRTDIDKRLEASQKANRLMDAFTDWQGKNPNATREEGIEWLRQQTKADRETRKAALPSTQGGFDWRDAIPSMPWQAYRAYKYFNPDQPPSKEQIQQMKGTEMILKKGQTMTDKQKEIEAGTAPDFRGEKSSASIRFNNPGAMYPGPSAKKFGSVGTEIIGGGHQIAVFPDAVSGAAAQFDLLANRYTGKTLKEAITTWSGGNDVPTYLRVIQKETGLAPGDKLTKEMIADPKIAIAIAKAMALQEAGKAYPLSDEQWLAAHKKAFA